MTAKPDDFADFATDTNFTNGPDVGTATKIEPSAGELAEGHIRETAPSAQKENWWKWLVGQWTHYLDEQIIALHVQVDQQPALNFRVHNHGDTNYAFYAATRNAWLLCGDTESVLETRDWGSTHNSSIVASAGAGENCIHGSADAAGNLVIATSTRYIFQRTQSSLVVTKVDVHGGAATFDEVQVVYDSVRAKWLWWSREVGSNYAKNSPDRTTWTNCTAPAFDNDTAFTKRMVANPTTGRILFVTRNSTPNRLYIERSDDAGATWVSAAGTFIDIASWTPDAVSLAYDDVAAAWVLAASSTSDTTCKVWRSADDGETWTEVSSLTGAFIEHIAVVGNLWAALATGISSQHDLLWSTDSGDTWNKGGFAVTDATGIYAAAGGFVITTGTSYVYFGHRLHAPALGVAT